MSSKKWLLSLFTPLLRFCAKKSPQSTLAVADPTHSDSIAKYGLGRDDVNDVVGKNSKCGCTVCTGCVTITSVTGQNSQDRDT